MAREPWPWEDAPPRPQPQAGHDPLGNAAREHLERVQGDGQVEGPVCGLTSAPMGSIRRGRDGLIRRIRNHSGASLEEAQSYADQAIGVLERKGLA